MVKEIKKDGKSYFVCDCGVNCLTWIINNKQICSNCKFRLECDVVGDMRIKELKGGLNNNGI